ncbi:hypothetical protein [Pseudomonas sp. EGD-AK9]|uniref:hypothetical protein n=1 Tax=Pseudomonas sp. EGD-AK9 TaxID=1386078 RepID=UPI0012E22C56|nr:hypothetical protein [Pseudomonas sp. EGD-AK9]
MHEFTTPILDWLSTIHGSGARGQYGWALVLMLVVVASRHISQNEASSQRKCLKNKIEEKLSERKLSASAIVEIDNKQSKINASLQKSKNIYILEILTSSSDTAEQKIDVTMSTVDDLELYLSEHTCFLLSDFK